MLDAKLVELDRGVRGVVLENDQVLVTILPDKGADIYQWIHKGTGVDVMWKSPWGLRRPGGGIPTSFDSAVTWIEWYSGGWQILFPNGGNTCTYKGVEMSFHGETSAIAWDIAELNTDDQTASVRLETRLARSPFAISREMVLPQGASSFLIRETIRNDGGEPMDYMWGHHPAFGAPFLSADCVIDTNARKMIADPKIDPPNNPMTPGEQYEWPNVEANGTVTDLSLVTPEQTARGSMGYLDEFDDIAWYGITNTHLGIGAGLAWRRDDFPYAWFWQEMHNSPGFPWYKGVYVMAIEPSTTWPGHGLVNAIEQGERYRTLQPGESRTAEIRAVLYESKDRISGIDMEGTIRK